MMVIFSLSFTIIVLVSPSFFLCKLEDGSFIPFIVPTSPYNFPLFMLFSIFLLMMTRLENADDTANHFIQVWVLESTHEHVD